MAVQSPPMLLLTAPAGWLLDRWQLRRVLFVTALSGAVQAACLAVLVHTGAINLAWVFGLALVLGCVQVFDRPAGQPLSESWYRQKQLPAASACSAPRSPLVDWRVQRWPRSYPCDPSYWETLSSLTFQEPSLFGVAESLNAVTALITAFVLAQYLHSPTTRTVAFAALSLGSSLLLTAISPTAPLFLASMLYFGFDVVWYTTSSQSLVQQASPPEVGGRMMSLYVLGGMGTTPVALLVVGARGLK